MTMLEAAYLGWGLDYDAGLEWVPEELPYCIIEEMK
jgi:hypothetical protein